MCFFGYTHIMVGLMFNILAMVVDNIIPGFLYTDIK